MTTLHVPEPEAFGAKPQERPVPRISIHAFVEFPDTGAALQRAGADRRLAKAHLNVQLGGINAAVEHYHGVVTPNLLIVETRLNGEAALEELDRLAHVCDPATKVIVVGRVNDVVLYRELMRRGASEYLVAPRRSAASWLSSARAVARVHPRSPTTPAGAWRRKCTSIRPSSISTCRSEPRAWISTMSRARESPMRWPRRSVLTTFSSTAS
jgi:DNA-binding NarL/FixJ family response regulator